MRHNFDKMMAYAAGSDEFSLDMMPVAQLARVAANGKHKWIWRPVVSEKSMWVPYDSSYVEKEYQEWLEKKVEKAILG